MAKKTRSGRGWPADAGPYRSQAHAVYPSSRGVHRSFSAQVLVSLRGSQRRAQKPPVVSVQTKSSAHVPASAPHGVRHCDSTCGAPLLRIFSLLSQACPGGQPFAAQSSPSGSTHILSGAKRLSQTWPAPQLPSSQEGTQDAGPTALSRAHW